MNPQTFLIRLMICFPCFFSSQLIYSKDKIIFIEETVDSSAGNVKCYKIVTPTTTYFLEKEGLGLSSMLDCEGIDWINFHPLPGSKAGGEYRGFPNAIHNQKGSFFHPKNSGTQYSTSKIIKESTTQITIEGISENESWHCQWDFYLTHCTFTMTKMPCNYKYWVLYEGTPGGEYNNTDFYMTSSIREKINLTTPYETDIQATEWIAFGDKQIKRVLFLAHHEDDNKPDKFFQMNGQMTVFGFGRDGLKQFIDDVPQHFSIGFVESVKHNKIDKAIHKLIQFQ